MDKYQIDNDNINIYKNIKNSNKNSILLIHGAGMSHSIWLEFAEILINNGFNVVIPDLPAHGESDGCPIQSISEYSKFIEKIISEFNLPNLSIIGHSMGGLIALDYVANNNDDVKNMVLIGTNLVMPVHPNLLEIANTDYKKASNMIIEWSLYSNKDNDLIKKISSTMKINNDKALYYDLLSCNEYKMAEENLSKVKIPVFVITGENDNMTPIKYMANFKKISPKIMLETIEKCGHMAMVEKLDNLSEKTLEFLS